MFLLSSILEKIQRKGRKGCAKVAKEVICAPKARQPNSSRRTAQQTPHGPFAPLAHPLRPSR